MVIEDEYSLYDETNDDFGDRDSEEYPEFVQQFSEKQEKEAKAEKVFAAKLTALIAVVIAAIFYICWKIYT